MRSRRRLEQQRGPVFLREDQGVCVCKPSERKRGSSEQIKGVVQNAELHSLGRAFLQAHAITLSRDRVVSQLATTDSFAHLWAHQEAKYENKTCMQDKGCSYD